MSDGRGYIGVDLDGVLAYFDRWRGVNHIGKPIAAMVKRVQSLLANGHKVVVFTARMEDNDPGIAKMIGDWTEEHIGVRLEATAVKRRAMIMFYDDKAHHVIPNTGKVVSSVNKMKDR